MDRLKLQIDILKIKLAFFSSLTGGTAYIILNVDKLDFLNKPILYTIFASLLLYGALGVFINISFLNEKYKELE